MNQHLPNASSYLTEMTDAERLCDLCCCVVWFDLCKGKMEKLLQEDIMLGTVREAGFRANAATL